MRFPKLLLCDTGLSTERLASNPVLVGARYFRGLRSLVEASGDRFRRGVVLYKGRTTMPFARDMYALPVSSLWKMTA